jgi:hypothetical protein
MLFLEAAREFAVYLFWLIVGKIPLDPPLRKGDEF